MGSQVKVFVAYKGLWELDGTCWRFKNAKSSVISISKDVTYSQITDILHEDLVIDKLKYGIRLEVPYTVDDGQPFPPVEIRRDSHVRLFMEEASEKRITLCVTLVKKDAHVAQDIPSDEVDAPNHLTIPSEVGDHLTIPSEVGDHTVPIDINDGEGEGDMASNPVAEDCLPSQRVDSSFNSVQDGTKWSSPIFSNDDVMASQMTTSTSNVTTSIEFHVGRTFDNKIQLKTQAALYAIKNNFEYQVKKSGTYVWYIKCKDADCFWRLRGKKLKDSSLFEITSYHSEHTCSLDVRQKDHRQAAPWVVGHLIKNKFAIEGTGYLANDIRDDMKKQYGIDMSYEKAWRCREKALTYVRGTLEDSYSKLPAFLYMLQQRNPGTITDFVTEDGRFLYCFFALGASINGFKLCRPVICVDGTFLKTKYGGHMLCAVALDANNQLFPIAHAIVDSENHNSYSYFMRKLKQAIGDVEDLAFVSDRHNSINHALLTVFPNAYHGACYHHLSMNVKHKFKTDHCHQLMWLAAYAFRKTDSKKHFDQIKAMDPAIAGYLEGIGFERWSRAYFPGNRYNIMTSNYAESFNNKTKEARSFPITTFVEFIRFTLQTWFCQRRDDAMKCNTRLSKLMETDLRLIADKSRFMNIQALGQNEFVVADGDCESEVNLVTKSCSCGMFQIIGIPCVHVVCAAKKRGVNIYSLCSPFYTVESWRETYRDIIYPCGNEEEWKVFDDINNIQVGVPIEKNPVGRPKKQKLGRPKRKRLPSMGEVLVKSRKCSRCGGSSHNRASCKVRM